LRNLKRCLSLTLITAMVSSFATFTTTAVASEPGSDSQLSPAGLNYDQYPALKDVYKDYFKVGTVGSLAGPRSGLISYNFNAYTPENEMKPQSVQNVKGNFTFDTLDGLLNNVTTLSSDIALIGHTLAWHSQTPNWMWDAPNFDRDTALDNLNTHIDSVLGRYGGQLYSIDVVNEAIGKATPSDWKASLDKGEGWSLALSSDWVELAFLEAAKVIDENGWDTKLYYNDFGLDSEAKAQTVYAMVKEINEKYAGTRPNGKPLIEGIGMQEHYNSSTKPENVEASIKLFATLPGVSVSVTELDMEWPNLGSLTSEQAVAQAQKYAQFFQIYKKYAAGPANDTDNPKVIERVTFWGSNDGDSWKHDGLPLLFNAPSGTDITAKEALVAVLDPDTYLADNPIVDKPEQEQKEPVDGVHVYDTSKGDSWSGANIILGNNASAWPWSTAGEDGKAAFKPEKDATYRISVNLTSLGTNAIRMRWLKDDTNGSFTSADAAAVNSHPYSADQVATALPAYFNSGMSTGNSYTLVNEIKLDGSQTADGLIGNIAIRGGAGGNSFSINWIKVEKMSTGDASDKLLVNWPDGMPKAGTQGVHIYNTSNGDSWSGANIVLGNNASAWPWSTAGADGQVAFTPEKESAYRISVNYTSMGTSAIRVRWLKDESNGGYTSADAAAVNAHPYSASQVAAAIPAYFNSGMVNAGTYTVSSEVTMDGSQPADGLIGNIGIRGGAGGNSFLINWIKVEKIGTGGAADKLLVNWPEGIDEPDTEPGETEEPTIIIPPAGQTYEAYPALKDVYKDYFTMGIFGAGENNALIHNFASFTPGNQMKPESTQNVKGTFTYDSADNAFNNLAGQNPDILFYGHTLAWHSQTPTWMWDAPPARYGQPGTFDKDTALANLNNHIENVLGYYGGRLTGIDVVNEAVGTAKPNDWKASLAKGEGWYMALGWEWVELAFLKAASVVDSHPDWDVKLIYNDFGLDSPSKARVVYEMVKDINERYAGVRPNGKSLIEVIGMQSHYNLTTSAEDVENSIKLFATLPGVSINITEMDIGSPPVGVLTPENENNQAMKFAELFQIYKKYATGSANKTDNPKVIDRVSICGVRDATTGWRAGEFALLFTSEGLAKDALVAVLDPAAYLGTHEYIEPENGPKQEPLDGVHVYDAGNGDAWTGANIILGNDANAWPWSTAGEDGKVAFTPEKDAKYRLTFNYTAKGTTALRVRWSKDDTNGGYTEADGAAVNSHPYSAGEVAAALPAYFNSGMVNMGSYTLTTEIQLDGSQPANGLIGNIAIRGGGGGNAYTINWIKVEKIGAGGTTDQLLVDWPKKVEVPAAPAAPTNVSAQAKSTSEIEVSWTAADNATGYNVYRSALADGDYGKVNTQLITETKFRNSGLPASTTYYYKVMAVNDAGESELSVPAQATTNRSTNSGTSPSTPTDQTPVKPGEVKVEVDAKGNAKASVTADDVKKALSEAQAGTMKLQVQDVENIKQVTVSISVDQVEAAKEAGIKRIQISSGFASVQLPVSLFEGTASHANVELTIAKVDNRTLSDEVGKIVGSNTVYDFNLSVNGLKITNFGQGQSVKVAVPYSLKPGENPSQVVIYYLTDDGKLEVIKNGRYNKDTGMVEFNTKHFSKYAAIANPIHFNDAKAVAWASESIEGLAARGIVNGVTKDSFAPGNSVTRAEFIQMLMLALDLNQANATSTFSDVKQGAWYYNSIASAQQLGIVSGLTDGSFGTNNKINRQEMAAMAYQAIQKAEITLDDENLASGFHDAQDIASYAKEAVTVMNQAGIINGIGNDKFDPKGTATRAQAAVILYQLLMKSL
jgi:endo-1,4-beta-xylanase